MKARKVVDKNGNDALLFTDFDSFEKEMIVLKLNIQLSTTELNNRLIFAMLEGRETQVTSEYLNIMMNFNRELSKITQKKETE